MDVCSDCSLNASNRSVIELVIDAGYRCNKCVTRNNDQSERQLLRVANVVSVNFFRFQVSGFWFSSTGIREW